MYHTPLGPTASISRRGAACCARHECLAVSNRFADQPTPPRL